MAKSENFGNAIKTCSYKKPERCGKVLVKGVNWGGGTKYICWDCDRIRNEKKRLKKKQENPYGYVYVVFNPAWSEWYGVGKCDHNHEGRLAGYNVSSPLRDFRFLHLRKCNEPKILEDKVLEKLRKLTSIHGHEWFMLDFKTIVDIIEETYEEEELNA